MGSQQEIKEGEPLPTPPSPAIRYIPGETRIEQREAREFEQVTPPGGVIDGPPEVGSIAESSEQPKAENKPFFPREVTLVGSKRLVEHAMDEQKAGVGDNEEKQRYTMGYQIAKLTMEGLKLEPNQRVRLTIKWSEQGVPTITHSLEEVPLPRGASSVEQLEEEEQKARNAE